MVRVQPTWCMWKSSQGSEAMRRMVWTQWTVTVPVISWMVVTLFLA